MSRFHSNCFSIYRPRLKSMFFLQKICQSDELMFHHRKNQLGVVVTKINVGETKLTSQMRLQLQYEQQRSAPELCSPYTLCYLSHATSMDSTKFSLSRNFLNLISRNSTVFYWKSANLIGSFTVFYSPIENSRARVAPRPVVFLDFWL